MPSLCHPSWLVRRSKRLCGSGREKHYALWRTWLKCQSLRVQGALERDAIKDEILRAHQMPLLRLATTGSGEDQRIRQALDAAEAHRAQMPSR